MCVISFPRNPPKENLHTFEGTQFRTDAARLGQDAVHLRPVGARMRPEWRQPPNVGAIFQDKFPNNPRKYHLTSSSRCMPR